MKTKLLKMVRGIWVRGIKTPAGLWLLIPLTLIPLTTFAEKATVGIDLPGGTLYGTGTNLLRNNLTNGAGITITYGPNGKATISSTGSGTNAGVPLRGGFMLLVNSVGGTNVSSLNTNSATADSALYMDADGNVNFTNRLAVANDASKLYNVMPQASLPTMVPTNNGAAMLRLKDGTTATNLTIRVPSSGAFNVLNGSGATLLQVNEFGNINSGTASVFGGNGGLLTNLNGTKIQAATISSNSVDANTKALFTAQYAFLLTNAGTAGQLFTNGLTVFFSTNIPVNTISNIVNASTSDLSNRVWLMHGSQLTNTAGIATNLVATYTVTTTNRLLVTGAGGVNTGPFIGADINGTYFLDTNTSRFLRTGSTTFMILTNAAGFRITDVNTNFTYYTNTGTITNSTYAVSAAADAPGPTVVYGFNLFTNMSSAGVHGAALVAGSVSTNALDAFVNARVAEVGNKMDATNGNVFGFESTALIVHGASENPIMQWYDLNGDQVAIIDESGAFTARAIAGLPEAFIPAPITRAASFYRASFNTNVSEVASNLVLAGSPYRLDVSGNVVCVAYSTNVTFFTVTNGVPTPRHTNHTAFAINQVVANGPFFYCLGGNIAVFDATMPAAPVLVTNVSSGADNKSRVQDGLLLCASGESVIIYSVVNPALPVLLSSTDYGLGAIADVIKRGNLLYIAFYGEQTLKVADIANPRAPVIIHSQNVTSSDPSGFEPWRFWIYGNFLLVADDAWLKWYSLSNPTNPVPVTEMQITADDIEGLTLIDDTLIWSTANNTVFLDLQSPLSPVAIASNTVTTLWNTADRDYVYSVGNNAVHVASMPKFPRWPDGVGTLLAGITNAVRFPLASNNCGRVLTVIVTGNVTNVLCVVPGDYLGTGTNQIATNGQAFSYVSDGGTNWIPLIQPSAASAGGTAYVNTNVGNVAVITGTGISTNTGYLTPTNTFASWTNNAGSRLIDLESKTNNIEDMVTNGFTGAVTLNGSNTFGQIQINTIAGAGTGFSNIVTTNLTVQGTFTGSNVTLQGTVILPSGTIFATDKTSGTANALWSGTTFQLGSGARVGWDSTLIPDGSGSTAFVGCAGGAVVKVEGNGAIGSLIMGGTVGPTNGVVYPSNTLTMVQASGLFTNGQHWVGTISNSFWGGYMTNNAAIFTNLWGHP